MDIYLLVNTNNYSKKMSKEIIEQFKNFRLELKKDIEESRAGIVGDINEHISLLDNRIKEVETKVRDLDREIRKKNVVIYGIAGNLSDYWKTEKYVCDLFREQLDLDIAVTDIDFIRRLGQRGDNRKGLLLVGFTTFRIKLLVMQNVFKLKGSELLISNDFPKAVRERRKNLWLQVVEARKEGKMARLVYDKLVIREGVYAKNLQKKRLLSNSPPEEPLQEVMGKDDINLNKKNKVEKNENSKSNSETPSVSIHSLSGTRIEGEKGLRKGETSYASPKV